MQLLLANKKVEIVINEHRNPKRDMEIGISQGLPVLLILFLIYINGIFNTITITSLEITSVLFMDNFEFLTYGNSIEEVTTSLKTTGEIVFR